MAGQPIRRLAALVILVATAACDNVEWGGMKVALEAPPPVVAPAAADSGIAPSDIPLPPLPQGPVLYMGMRTGERVTLRPVAEVTEDGLAALPEEADAPGFAEHLRTSLLAPGSEFSLFAGGVRVGTLVADSSAILDDACAPRPIVSGPAELALAAAGATRFIGLARAAGSRVAAVGPFVPDQVTDELRALSLKLATRAIVREQALWPDDLARARADVRAVPLPGSDARGVAATFLFRDRLEVAPASNAAAYGLFVLGGGGANGRDLRYSRYRLVRSEGKGVPRYFEQADWDGDGDPEILLEVFGAEARWVAALDLRGGQLEQVFEEPCGTRSARLPGS